MICSPEAETPGGGPSDASMRASSASSRSELTSVNLTTRTYTVVPPGWTGTTLHPRRDGGPPPTRLTTAEGANAAWSPDGSKIAFGSNRTGNFEIYTKRADGTRQTQRTLRP